MEPLSALSIASSVFQIVDFSAKIIAKAKEIYQSAEGASTANSFLEDTTSNLTEITAGLARELWKNSRTASNSKQGKKTAEEQLVKLAEESRTIAASLLQKLNQLKLADGGGRWKALQQAFRIAFAQKEIDALTMRLDSLQKQVDTALLISLRYECKTYHPKCLLMVYSNRMEVQSTEMDKLPTEGQDERKARVWNLLQDHNWRPSEEAHLIEFSSVFHSAVESDVEKRFCDMILARLHFSEMPRRHEMIAEAHIDTFQWVLNDQCEKPGPEPAKWDSFTEWLSNTTGENVYWIAGKPGSGKSTLMKYLFDHSHIAKRLSTWSANRQIVKAGFFFWNSGSVMQMSRLGLLQTLLYTILSESRESILELFAQRWQKFIAFSGGRQAFTWAELQDAFLTIIGNTTSTKAYFFMLDGLDEFDGDHKGMVELVLNVAQHAHVKVCVASRPWLVFSDAFEQKPKLFVEDLTKNDIRNYVAAAFNDNRHYLTLKGLEPKRTSDLIEGITAKAAGVFLWVYLVVRSLLDGLSNADRISDLERRLEALPPDLEDLYDKLWRSLDKAYFKHSCQLLLLVMFQAHCGLLSLWYADDEDDNTAIQLETRCLCADEIRDRHETMERRLRSRCKCFLEVDGFTERPDYETASDDRKTFHTLHLLLTSSLISDSTKRSLYSSYGERFCRKPANPASDQGCRRAYIFRCPSPLDELEVELSKD